MTQSEFHIIIREGGDQLSHHASVEHLFWNKEIAEEVLQYLTDKNTDKNYGYSLHRITDHQYPYGFVKSLLDEIKMLRKETQGDPK